MKKYLSATRIHISNPIYFRMETFNNLLGFEQIGVDNKVGSTLIFEEIRKELEGYLLEQSLDSDSTDGVFDFLATQCDRIQEEFDKILEGESDKKRFLRTLTRIFALLLNTNVETLDKIKRILKIAVETTIKLWSGQN